jgi:molybdopterin molybdotransferase
MLSVEEARAYLLDRARRIEETEPITIEDSLGRIVTADVEAPIDVPGHANSAMDGYAVRSTDIPDEGEATLRVTQRITAGEVGSTVAAGEAARIFTGAPIPEGADAIAIQEDCRRDGASVTVPGPLAPGTFVRPRGNDIRCGAVVLAAGTRVRPQEMGVAASVGIERIDVRRRPRVAIVSSGDELRRPGESLGPGQIYNSNRFTLLGLLRRLGCDIVDLGLVADTFEATRGALLDGAARADVLITTGGVSVGEEDHVRQALEAIGELEMWKVRVKPGKPIIYGRIGPCDLLGLPGNPVSALVTFCLFVRPFILRRLGAVGVFPAPVPLTARFEWPKPGGRREFARARMVVDEDDEPGVEVHTRQGSDVLSATAWATGLVEIAEGTTVVPGDRVRYYSFGDLLD